MTTGTFVQTGEIPVRFGPPETGSKENRVVENGKVRETREFDGKTYSMETAIKGDVAILRAWKVDEAGNCQFRYVCVVYKGSKLIFSDTPPKDLEV